MCNRCGERWHWNDGQPASHDWPLGYGTVRPAATRIVSPYGGSADEARAVPIVACDGCGSTTAEIVVRVASDGHKGYCAACVVAGAPTT